MTGETSFTLPIFKRGLELEMSTQQDVEQLRGFLAMNKINIPQKNLEKGIIVPRDIDNYHPGYP